MLLLLAVTTLALDELAQFLDLHILLSITRQLRQAVVVELKLVFGN